MIFGYNLVVDKNQVESRSEHEVIEKIFIHWYFLRMLLKRSIMELFQR